MRDLKNSRETPELHPRDISFKNTRESLERNLRDLWGMIIWETDYFASSTVGKINLCCKVSLTSFIRSFVIDNYHLSVSSHWFACSHCGSSWGLGAWWGSRCPPPPPPRCSPPRSPCSTTSPSPPLGSSASRTAWWTGSWPASSPPPSRPTSVWELAAGWQQEEARGSFCRCSENQAFLLRSRHLEIFSPRKKEQQTFTCRSSGNSRHAQCERTYIIWNMKILYMRRSLLIST